MIGKRGKQRELFDVGNVYDLALPPASFHAQLARAADRLFRDEEFAAFYAERLGRPSVPPSQLALLTLLQHEAGCSDEEAVARSAYDLRWAAVLRRKAGEPLCAKSTFQLFRAHLVLHDTVRTLFERSLQEAKRAGLLKGGALKIAVDTKPILGRGAVQDTYNLLGTGIQQLSRALSSLANQQPAAWATAHDLGRYFAPSLKGTAELDWSNPVAREAFLTEIVIDARRLLRLAGEAVIPLDEARRGPVREAAQLLEALLLQDVVETTDEAGRPQATVRAGTAKGRMPSATDPQVRHGHKSKRRRFEGHKAAIATDTQTQLIVGADVLAGDAPDAQGLLAQVEQVEQNTGQAVSQTLGDCAYGSGATRQQFADAHRTLVARVPQEGQREGFFPKRRFVIDLAHDRVICPGQSVTEEFQRERDGTKVFQFGWRCKYCTLQQQCTTALGGRTIQVHPQEALLRAARQYQRTPAGQDELRARVVAEHRLARLGQLGIGQARYVGRKKTRFQLLVAATLANLRRTWNWERDRPPAPARESAASGEPGGRVGDLMSRIRPLVPWEGQRLHPGGEGSLRGWSWHLTFPWLLGARPLLSTGPFRLRFYSSCPIPAR
jgi:hypothetical protein